MVIIMDFIVGLISIVTINLMLSGDNALVIALASRNLSPRRQKYAVILGGAGAVVLRIVLTFLAVYLLRIPYLQMLGGVLLLWIAVKLAKQDSGQACISVPSNLGEAVRTIIIADVVMSLDNVIAITGVAKGNISLLVIGLGISIPIILWGSRLIHCLIEKWPVIIMIGAAFLGWTAGGMMVEDQKLAPFLAGYPWMTEAVSVAFAALVFILSTFSAKQRRIS